MLSLREEADRYVREKKWKDASVTCQIILDSIPDDKEHQPLRAHAAHCVGNAAFKAYKEAREKVLSMPIRTRHAPEYQFESKVKGAYDQEKVFFNKQAKQFLEMAVFILENVEKAAITDEHYYLLATYYKNWGKCYLFDCSNPLNKEAVTLFEKAIAQLNHVRSLTDDDHRLLASLYHLEMQCYNHPRYAHKKNELASQSFVALNTIKVMTDKDRREWLSYSLSHLESRIPLKLVQEKEFDGLFTVIQGMEKMDYSLLARAQHDQGQFYLKQAPKNSKKALSCLLKAIASFRSDDSNEVNHEWLTRVYSDLATCFAKGSKEERALLVAAALFSQQAKDIPVRLEELFKKIDPIKSPQPSFWQAMVECFGVLIDQGMKNDAWTAIDLGDHLKHVVELEERVEESSKMAKENRKLARARLFVAPYSQEPRPRREPVSSTPKLTTH